MDHHTLSPGIRSWYNVAPLQQFYCDQVMLENYVDVEEAAKMLGVHPETVKRLIRKETLPATKVGNKWLIDRERVQNFALTYDGARGRPKRFSMRTVGTQDRT